MTTDKINMEVEAAGNGTLAGIRYPEGTTVPVVKGTFFNRVESHLGDCRSTMGVKEKYDRLIAEGVTPIKRWGQPVDIGKAITAIAEGYQPFSTGQVINVDGGFHIQRL